MKASPVSVLSLTLIVFRLDQAEAGVMGPILVDPRDSDTLYVSSMQGGFRKSTDSGESWETISPFPRGGMVMSISQNWKNPDTFYAANGRKILKSTDGGESWRPVGGELPGISAVAVAPSDSIVYAGVLEGDTATVYRSDNGGEIWRARN